MQDDVSQPQTAWSDMMAACPKCGNRTYTYGNVLPGQYPRGEGMIDDRIRDRVACVSCDYRGVPTLAPRP